MTSLYVDVELLYKMLFDYRAKLCVSSYSPQPSLSQLEMNHLHIGGFKKSSDWGKILLFSVAWYHLIIPKRGSGF